MELPYWHSTISKKIIEKAIENKLDLQKNNSKRECCARLLGNDIGAYNTCGHLCKYCYANKSEQISLI